jgi:RIO-like serine/threonine protein kinase
MKVYQKGNLSNRTSIIIIDKNIVTKEVIYKDRIHELVAREVFWLNHLKDTGFVPKILSTTANSITMEYIGPSLNKTNLPKNAESQLLQILLTLNEYACFYNDWKPENILVKDNKLYLIDFGWCPIINQDFTCNGNIKTDLLNKPSGDRFLNVCEFIRSK